MNATGGLIDSANEIPETLLDACRSMGRELGMSEGELSGNGVEATRSVCEAVSSRMRDELTEIRAVAGVTVELRTRPPVCSVSVEAYAGCAAECEVDVDPGSVEMTCEGGYIQGGCSAECSGHCAVDATASCSGVCEGWCEGNCSATASDGSCAGACDGNCHGQCVAEVSGSCGGTCRGGCSVEFQEPTCTGTVTPPSVSADCRAACDARMDAQASCTPGEVEIVITGELGTDLLERAERVQAAARAGLGTILSIKSRLQRLRDSGQQVIELAGGLPAAVVGVGVEAANCARGALAELQGAVSNITVSVEVSVTVSGSIVAG